MFRSRIFVFLLLVTSSCLLLSHHAMADPDDSPPGIPEEILEKLKEINVRANKAAAKHLGVPLASIEACRKTGFPLYFSMFQVVIADEAKLPVKEVNQARIDGYNWGEMCKAWGLSLKKVRARVGKAFTKMVKDSLPPPSPTLKESRRAANTGRRNKPLRGKP